LLTQPAQSSPEQVCPGFVQHRITACFRQRDW
jgi:hypothetical protein